MNDAILAQFLSDTIGVYRKHKELAEGALAQIDDAAFFRSLGERSHPIAVIVKHVAGNLRSRWTDFLTTDGEKPDRGRDNEFLILPGDSRSSLMAAWERGWGILFASLEALKPADLERTVRIRNEPYTVFRAIQVSITHTTYHVGQITYLCRMLVSGDWKWLTVPPAQPQGKP